MEEKLLNKLLHEMKESDRFDFKSVLKIYQSDGKLVEKQRDELLKDILGLANGNSHIIRKTKYLIIGADDNKFDKDGMRVLYNVDYKIPEQSQLVKWLSSASSPAIVGVTSELISFQGVNLWVITIPPTFELHETTRELNASGHFQNHVVFMRQDEHTVPASVRDGVTIQQLKHLHRQEVSNPSAIWLGVIIGGLVSSIIGSAKIEAAKSNLVEAGWIGLVVFTIVGIILGGSVGFFVKVWNETRYDFRYMTFRQKFLTIVFLVMTIFIGTVLIK